MCIRIETDGGIEGMVMYYMNDCREKIVKGHVLVATVLSSLVLRS